MAAGLAPPVGTLYIVATPIGNLEDITLRALRVLREVRVIAAEDTRRTRILLARYDIQTALLSYREQNRAVSTPLILRHLGSGSVALVSDAGMPGIADPGAELISQVAGMGGRVEAVPGPNAALTALVASGLPPAPFTFVGFLSRQRGDRRRQLMDLAARPETLVFYEAPHRLLQTLRDMQTVWGERAGAACRELTKRHEEIRRGSIGELLEYYTMVAPRGEFTLVVAGYTHKESHHPSDDEIDHQLTTAMTHSHDMRHIINDIATTTELPRRVIYARWQALRRRNAGEQDEA